MIKKWLGSDIAILIRRIAVMYLVLALCRVIFYVYNADIIGRIESHEFSGLIRGSLMFDTVSILYIGALFILLSLLPVRDLRKNGIYRYAMFIYYMIVNFIAVAVSMGDVIYFHYAQKRFTSDEIFFADNDNSLPIMGKFAVENWYLVLAGLAMIWFAGWSYRRKQIPETPIKSNGVYYTVNIILFFGVSWLTFGGVRGGFTRATRPITLSNASQYNASVNKATLILSNPFCIIRTMGNTKIVYKHYFTQQELDALYSPYHYPDKIGKLTEINYDLGRRNVVIFILESFSAEHSAELNPDLYPDGKGYTPFLDSLMRQGYTFRNAHSNGRKSIDALPSIFASIPSFKTPFVLLPQSMGEGMPLPKILASDGYSTMFMCGSPAGSMGFEAYAKSVGIQDVYSREDYENAHGKDDFDGYWGIWDEQYISFMGEILDRTKQPFFSSIFTLTSHHPFVIPDKYKNSLPEGKTKVHRGVAYTDMSVRKFFERYGDSEWFRNTIFVFVGDHVSSEVFAPKTKTPTGNTHIISLIYTPDKAILGMDSRTSQQIDIMPTLLALLGYDKPYFAFGRDVLREDDRIPMAVNYMNQSFQAITDSTVVFFDERRVLSAYSRSDTLQRTDISTVKNDAILRTEATLKAFIQQYYSHLERRSFVVR